MSLANLPRKGKQKNNKPKQHIRYFNSYDSEVEIEGHESATSAKEYKTNYMFHPILLNNIIP